VNQKTARDLRRETKRTLGNHLKAFAANEHARIDGCETRVVALEGTAADHGQRIDALWFAGDYTAAKIDVENSTAILRRRFFGRLKWLVLGR
jgi:hypothetical protein